MQSELQPSDYVIGTKFPFPQDLTTRRMFIQTLEVRGNQDLTKYQFDPSLEALQITTVQYKSITKDFLKRFPNLKFLRIIMLRSSQGEPRSSQGDTFFFPEITSRLDIEIYHKKNRILKKEKEMIQHKNIKFILLGKIIAKVTINKKNKKGEIPDSVKNQSESVGPRASTSLLYCHFQHYDKIKKWECLKVQSQRYLESSRLKENSTLLMVIKDIEFPQLRQIYLPNCSQIQSIEPLALLQAPLLQSLRMFNLGGNNIRSLMKGNFKNLKLLKITDRSTQLINAECLGEAHWEFLQKTSINSNTFTFAVKLQSHPQVEQIPYQYIIEYRINLYEQQILEQQILQQQINLIRKKMIEKE